MITSQKYIPFPDSKKILLASVDFFFFLIDYCILTHKCILVSWIF